MADKGDNFGAGLPTALFSKIDGLLTGSNARGTPVEQAALYRELALEERAALHPGKGTASMADAMLKYLAIAQAAEELLATPVGPGAPQTAAINKLVPAINGLGALWTLFGPVRDEFLDSTKA